MSDTPVRRWAAGHARSVAAGTRAAVPAGRDDPPAELAPAVLASCTEISHWPAGDRIFALTMARSADGTVALATARIGGSVGIWDPLTGDLTRTLTGHTDGVWCAEFGSGPDGEPLLASGGADKTARIWDPATGETLHTLTGHSEAVAGVAWGKGSAGRPFLITASRDKTAKIWDPATGELRRTLTVSEEIWNVAAGYRADGRAVLAIACWDGTVSTWDPDTGAAGPMVSLPGDNALSLAWGRRPGREPILAAAGDSPVARIWPDWASPGDDAGAARREVAPDTGDMFGLSWAPLDDGRTLLATATSKALHVWDGLTGERLYSAEYEYGHGYNTVDWALAPTGQLLLAAASADDQVRVWEVVLDPPARPSRAAEPPAAEPRAGVTAPASRPLTILDPPQDVTPDFPDSNEGHRPTFRVSAAVDADGHVLLAALGAERSSGSLDPEVQIWDASDGILLRTVMHPTRALSSAWGKRADGRPLLATGGADGTARIWDPDTGETLQTLIGNADSVPAVAWGYRPDGQPLLATGSGGTTAQIWEPDTGQLLHTLTGHTSTVLSVAWGYRPDGRPLLATASFDKTARIWDPDTGELLRILTGHTNSLISVAWDHSLDGQPLLATGSDDQTARIWDPDTGELVRILTGHTGPVSPVAWGRARGGRPCVATAYLTARIWDPETGDQLASVPCASHNIECIALVQDRAGDLLLLVANPASGGGPAHIWRIATGLDADPARRPEPAGRLTPRQAGELSGWLLRLGTAGLWAPLGLLADLVELTGTEPPAGDGRLAALAGEPGITRLRNLGWAPAARVALAALIAARLTLPAHYAPPAEATPAALRDALTQALAERPDTTAASPVPVADLRAAATQITGQTVTLLRILGPAACAADPLLPARLAHRIPQLPALSPRELHLLTTGTTRHPGTRRTTATGTLRYSPGTTGLTRTGSLTRLLPTQLALPRDLLTLRLAANQLLYRQHRSPAPPAPNPVTIILDTTPPTIGPAGNTLRLAAHLIATTLWDYDRYPALITTASPGTLTELRSPADLVGIWANATLDDPAGPIASALHTAAAAGRPVVLATHFQTARDHDYAPGPGTRLLTAHHPPERPPPAPASRWHAHLSPGPTHAQLSQAISSLLGGRDPSGN